MNNRWYTTSQWTNGDDPELALRALKNALARHVADEPVADINPSAWHRWSLQHGAIIAEMLRIDEEVNPAAEWLDDTQADNGRENDDNLS